MPNHDARAIANEFLARAKRDGLALTNMQLQKLPYIAHGWSLALLNAPLIEERPQAWPYGPVYPSLYASLRRYGSGAVTALICDKAAIDPFSEDGLTVNCDLSKDEQKLIEAVWNVYRKYTAYQLSDMTHRDDTPCTKTVKELGKKENIPEQFIREHYKKLLQRSPGN